MITSPIKITKTSQSKISTTDFSNIPFGKTFSDHMYLVEYSDGAWGTPEIKPIENLSIHPGNLAWHYGQAIFEGMKATRDKQGNPLLFRPEMHVERLNKSAVRMCMPELPKEMFLDAIRTLVRLESKWIPKEDGSALYLRPLMFASDEYIGVRASENYTFLIFAMPVGPYYPKPVSLKAEETYIRAAQGGVGEAKTAGNYAASLYPAMLAKKAGYDQVMWLDSKEFKYIQEVGTMNIFFVIGDRVITPITNGTILKGITRDSIIHILRSKDIVVEERLISIDEVVKANEEGQLHEVFGSGTAALVAVVNRIGYKGVDFNLDVDTYKVAPMLKETINGIRNKSIPDSFGWVEALEIEGVES